MKISGLKKNMVISISFALLSLLLLVSTAYAWFALSGKTESSSIVATVSDFDISTDLRQIDDFGYTIPETFGKDNFIPGESIYYSLCVKNDTSSTGSVYVLLSDIISKGVKEDAPWKKIQYACSYEILDCFWVNDSDELFESSISPNNPLPSNEVINSLGLTRFTNEEKTSYYGQSLFDVDTSSPVIFNDVVDVSDATTYELLNDVMLSPNNESNHSFVVYFKITYLSDATLPSIYSSNEAPQSVDFVEQGLYIDSIKVIGNHK